MKVLVTPTSLQKESGHPALEKLYRFADEVVFNPWGRPLKEQELIPLLKGCDGFLAGLDYITEGVLEASPALKAISRYGAGVDRVDVAAAARRGITVTNTPGMNAEAVAELAMGLTLCLARKIPALHRKTCGGEWVRSTGIELFGKTMGILGLGAVGKKVARCARGFGMEILAYDPYLDKAYCQSCGIRPAALDKALRESDVVSLHLPLNDGTRHMIGEKQLLTMRPGAFLVNTSRGGIIDEEAAYKALKSGSLGGLALDAFEQEPPGDSPLFSLENVVATPHTGAHTREAVDNMAFLAVDNLMGVLSGKRCGYEIGVEG